ncbi:ATP-binding protein [Desulfitibacter alkalitolerans]|uniref:ATP-binding protein n=1 Tax=Desulfitibacter alkalitolerans TaxID=264641 RepID=UPI00047F2929|nr:ATP-binding protein [Desulfitibacter alkalitolerans]
MEKQKDKLINQIHLEVLYEFSNIITISPSCTCILEDLLEMIINGYQGEDAAVFIKGRDKHLKPLANINGLLDMRFPYGLFSNVFAGETSIYDAACLKEYISLKDLANHTLITVPLRISHEVVGIFLLLRKGNKALPKSQMTLLEIMANEISLALGMEIAKKTIDDLKDCGVSVLESLAEGVIIENAEQIIFCSQRAVELLDLKHPIQTYNNLEEHLFNISKEPVKTQIYLETGKSINNDFYSYEIETKSGKYLKISRFIIKGRNHNIPSYGYLFNDITRDKEMDRFKNDLIAMVSHELRTPLTTIKGISGTLLRKDVTWDEDAKTSFLMDISDECTRLNNFIQKLLDISKIDASALKLHKGLITVDKLISKIENFIKIYYRQIPESNFIIENYISDILEIDEERITQVFMNIIENSIKYGRKNVKINIKVDYYDEKAILFLIMDNGPGIKSSDLNKVFDKFYRCSKDSSLKGTGLGLAICKGFIEAHGGSIWAKSNGNKGTSIYFTLPINTQSKEGDCK